jgi:hypothetical protein
MRTTVVLLLLASSLAADEKPIAYPVPSVFPSPNENYRLVLVPPKTTDPRLKENAAQQEIRQQYTTSGLYELGGSKPLWTVDWFDYENFPANDGIHLVRFHGQNSIWRPYPSPKKLPDELIAEQLSSPAVSFYKKGELLRTYTVRELVERPNDLPHTMKFILWNAGGVYTKDGERFVLMTQDARQLFFDVTTGKILESRDAGLGNTRLWVIRLAMAAAGASIFVVFGLFLLYLRKK